MSDDVTGRQQEEVALADLEARAVEAMPRAEPSSLREWVRDNLFGSTWQTVQTVLAAAILGFLAYAVLRWIFFTAEWRVVQVNLTNYMIGRFPRVEVWRIWTCLFLVVALSGFTYGALEKRIRWSSGRVALASVIGVGGLLLLLFLLDGVGIWIWIGALTATFAAMLALGRLGGRRRLRRAVVVGWIVIYPLIVTILIGFGGPSPRAWGGLLLNLMVGSIGIVASFPIGILLALGRRSSFPVIRTFCVGVIELLRGVPLITLLFAGFFILPLLLPPQLDLPRIIRVSVMFTIFSAVYVAEIVRGGLQGVHHGQYEAARALGLPTWRLTAFVILPQALRNTIPALISHFISVWKDTSLLSVVASFDDLLAMARQSAAGLDFIGTSKQVLFAAGLIFWAIAISLGRWSQRVERRVGVGER